MSDTKKHKDQGKFHNKILKANEVCSSTKKMWDRHNGDLGEFRKAKKLLKNKILERDMKKEIDIIQKGENIDFDIQEQDEILIEKFGRI